MANATYLIATTMDGARMASAIGGILHRLNSSLINKEVEKKKL